MFLMLATSNTRKEIKLMGYIIENKSDQELAWNNTTQSWESEDFDTFSNRDRESLMLPTNGKWVRVPWNLEKEE